MDNLEGDYYVPGNELESTEGIWKEIQARLAKWCFKCFYSNQHNQMVLFFTWLLRLSRTSQWSFGHSELSRTMTKRLAKEQLQNKRHGCSKSYERYVSATINESWKLVVQCHVLPPVRNWQSVTNRLWWNCFRLRAWWTTSGPNWRTILVMASHWKTSRRCGNWGSLDCRMLEIHENYMFFFSKPCTLGCLTKNPQSAVEFKFRCTCSLDWQIEEILGPIPKKLQNVDFFHTCGIVQWNLNSAARFGGKNHSWMLHGFS